MSVQQPPEDVLTPYHPVPRRPCPFFGAFGYVHGGRVIIWDNPGNCCAVTSKNSICRMVLNGKVPHWDHCPYNTPANQGDLTALLLRGIAFLPEFGPDGVPLQQFHDYVMSDRCPRPSPEPSQP